MNSLERTVGMIGSLILGALILMRLQPHAFEWPFSAPPPTAAQAPAQEAPPTISSEAIQVPQRESTENRGLPTFGHEEVCVVLRQLRETDPSSPCLPADSGRISFSRPLYFVLYRYGAIPVGDFGRTVELNDHTALAIFEASTEGSPATLQWVGRPIVPGDGFYATPRILDTTPPILYAPAPYFGTGEYNADAYLIRSGNRWRPVDTESWWKSVEIPAGREAWKGFQLNLERMQAEFSLWAPGDANCCPSGGWVHVDFTLRDTTLAIVDQRVMPGTRPRPEDRPVPREAARNMDFVADLVGWRVVADGGSRTRPDVPGSVEWTSEYGGSARMFVRGAPSSIHLVQPIAADLRAGSELVFEIAASGMSAATFAAQLGLDGNNGERAALVEPSDGTHRLVMTLRNDHEAGTDLRLTLVTWPGSATCWVRSLEIRPR